MVLEGLLKCLNSQAAGKGGHPLMSGGAGVGTAADFTIVLRRIPDMRTRRLFFFLFSLITP